MKLNKLVTLVIMLTFVPIMWAQDEQAAPDQASAQSLSVDEIVDNTNRVSYYLGDDGRARVKMTIHDARDRKLNREMTILRRDERDPENADQKNDAYCGEQKFYIYFHEPADVHKMSFLIWKHLDKDDDRWQYLPALDLVKRIASSDKRTSFVGSHFLYEDVSGRHIDADHHELVETTDNYYVLKNTPKKPELVKFAYYKMWIHRETFVVVQSIYYDKQDQPYRKYQALKTENIQDYITVTKARMTDLRDESYTDLEYDNVEYNIGLPEDIFTERYLRRPPYKYLK